MSLNKTKIEWTDYTWNPVTGCEHGCSYCYARSIANRFKGSKAWPKGFKPTFHMERLADLQYSNLIGKKIFVCSMADLFGDWVPDYWIECVIEKCSIHNEHIFQFLTKNPKRYECFDFPENCWLGTTVESETQAHRIDKLIDSVPGNNVRFVSFEPLLGRVEHPLEGIDWIIIGAQTGPGAKRVDESIIDELFENANLYDVPIFTKDNLGLDHPLRQYPCPEDLGRKSVYRGGWGYRV